MAPSLVLASRSPRRREILERAGLPFSVRVVDVPEIRGSGETGPDYVRRLSRLKAEAITRSRGEIVLGADTVVIIDEHVLEKPVNDADAHRMLRLLSGKEHRVLTGICLLHDGDSVNEHAETRVRFLALTEAEIAEYVSSGEPHGKAGAYAIQGLASKFIEGIHGCYFNVVGLPIALVYSQLRRLRLQDGA